MSFVFKQIETDNQSLYQIKALFSSSFPQSNKFSLEYLKWQYVDNPNGRVIGYNAFHNNVLVAHYATIPISMKINSKVYKGVLSLNTATHPNFQGKGLFTKLATMTYDTVRSSGRSFVIGVANGNSTYGFINKLGFCLVGSLDMKIGFGKIKIDDSKTVCRVWQENEIHWRLKNPSANYIQNKLGLYNRRNFLVKDVLKVPNQNIKGQDNTLSLVSSELFNLYVGLGANLSKYTYFNFPKIIKRPPFNLIFRDLTGGSIPPINKKQVMFQLIDFDVV